MKTKVNTARMRLLAVSIALAAAIGATLTAAAGTVCNSVSKGDPRYMTTGCRFDSAFASGAGSIGIWVKSVTDYSTNLGSPSCLFGSSHINTGTSNDQGLLLYISEYTGNFGFRVAGSKNGAVARTSVVAPGTVSKLNDGSWHFLLGTFDRTSGKMYFYVDGTAAGSADIDIDGLVSARCFSIAIVGRKTESTATEREDYVAGFVGLYAEATLWSKALTSEEVATLYTRRAYPWDDGLIGYWPLSTTVNLAQNAMMRNDGSRPNALCYGRSTVTDAGFFDNPPTRFVASVEWVAEKGYVPPAGATFNNPDEPATNVAEVVAAVSGDATIYLMPGTHRISEQVDITKANLTLTGKYFGYSGGEVIIDAQGLCRHFRSSLDYSGQDGWVFDGLKFVNGRAGGGGSIYAKSKTGKILNCVFEDNAATNGNGGAYFSYTANGSVISNCVFRCNSATSDGGAAYTQQNSNRFDDRQNFIGCTFSNNVARAGGGIYAERCVRVDGCLFKDNSARLGSDNSRCRGGHARVGIYSRILNSEFTGACTALGYGSCLDNGGADSLVSNCVFRGMTASGGYAMFHVGARTSFMDSIITNNNNNARIFFPESAADVVVRQCLIAGNTENQGVVWDWRSSSRFENCTILQQIFRGAGKDFGTNVLVNCILPNADIASSGAYVNILTNCLVKSVSGGTQDIGVMTGDPRFTDAAHGDYTLVRGSSCREKGMTLGWMGEGSVDLLGNPRVVDRNGFAFSAGALPDLGCYEIQEPNLGAMLIVW